MAASRRRFHEVQCPLLAAVESQDSADTEANGVTSTAAGSRFDSSTAQGKFYGDRYWNDAYFDALAEITGSAIRARNPGRGSAGRRVGAAEGCRN